MFEFSLLPLHIQRYTGLTPGLQADVFSSLFIVIGLWLMNRAITALLVKKLSQPRDLYRWKKTTSYILVTLGVVLVARIWVAGIQSLATFLGLLSAGLAIALRDLVMNLAGWWFIMWKKPFKVGDRIQIGDFRGDVIDQQVTLFTLMEIGNWIEADQATGRIIHMPNSKVFNEPLANYNRGFGFIWHELPVTITFESDWQKALKLLKEIVDNRTSHVSEVAEENLKLAAQKMMIFFQTLTPTVYTRVVDIGVCLTLRYLTEPRRRRETEQVLWKDILEAFAEHEDIDFAYPTQRTYFMPVENRAMLPGAAPLPVEVGQAKGTPERYHTPERQPVANDVDIPRFTD